MAKDKVRVDGDVASFQEPTRSGNIASRSFCAECGTAIYSEPAKSAGAKMVKLSVLDDAPWDTVKAAFWTSEKPAWFSLPADLKQFATQP
ncbi:GFA family protein [Novosphingobium sp. HII-3]|uniref:GFA family protein n=1 Tax=Novosphingobium sp. HII-3 TaxID=2075565 RepID=UPI001E33DBB5|nr:GFA family protein [Novosphingobium sp. HII-3]